MSHRELPLPRCYELLLGKDHDEWPLEARFINAAYYGDVRQIKKIAKDLDVQGYTPLEHAVIHGHLPAVRYLVDHGADLHQRRSNGNITLLHAAAVHASGGTGALTGGLLHTRKSCTGALHCTRMGA